MLTIIIIAKNEEQLLKTCLESVKWADQLIVADNGSTDKTVEIAKKYTSHIIHFEGQDFAALRNKAMDQAKGDWVLYIDADERILEPLKIEIQQVMESDLYAAYAVQRTNIIFGSEVHYGFYGNDKMIRMFKKDHFKHWVGKVHEHGEFEGALGYLKKPLLHLTHRDLDHVVLKSLDWSHIDADLRLKAHHPPMTGLRLIKILITETWHQGITKKGFFNGTVGVIDAMVQVFSLFMTYVRLWQLQQKPSLNETYHQIDQKLIESEFRNY